MEKKHPLGTKENFELIQTVLDPRIIDGALRSAIHAHGPITLGSTIFYDKDGTPIPTCSTSSASKRIRGAIRTRVAEYLKKKEEKQPRKWYSRFIRRT